MVYINVILKFLGTGCNYCHQAKVKIYDDNNIIYNCFSYNGKIKANLKKGNVYKVEASLHNYKLVTSIFVCNQDIFIFNLNQNDIRTITFQLTDYNYNNLPIMKGEIMLG